MNITLDIETCPTDRADVRDYIAATISAPAQMKKAETIAAWEANEKAAAVEEAVAKTGLDGSFGRVCVIGWAIDDGEPMTVASAEDEAYVLREFALRLVVPPSERHTSTVIGFNCASFDLRFLTQRFIVHGIKPPMVIARAAQAKPWESEKVFDCMVQWAGVGNRVSLDKLCLALGIPSPKGDMDGSKVAQYVKDGRIDEVAAYCARDIVATRAAYRRMTFASVPVVEFEDVSA